MATTKMLRIISLLVLSGRNRIKKQISESADQTGDSCDSSKLQSQSCEGCRKKSAKDIPDKLDYVKNDRGLLVVDNAVTVDHSSPAVAARRAQAGINFGRKRLQFLLPSGRERLPPGEF